ncbi:MAG: hypothetical protein EBX50_09565 [Chitinophagia bacterium]|nr:hypothetical protein [Chitinophagia bacterium]
MTRNIYCKQIKSPPEWILKDKNFLQNVSIDRAAAGHKIIDPSDISEELHSWLSQFNLELMFTELLWTNKGNGIFLHIDELDPPNATKINWVYETGTSEVFWYKLRSDNLLQKHGADSDYPHLIPKREDCELVHKQRVGKGFLFNAGVPHEVWNYSDSMRYTVSAGIREKGCEKRISWDRIEQLLSNVLSD